MTLFIWETQYYITLPKENINSTFLKKQLLNVQLVTTISFNIIKYMWKIPWSKPSAKQILPQSGSEGVYVYEGNAISLPFTHPLAVGRTAELTVAMRLLYAWHQLLGVKKLPLFPGEHLCLVKQTNKSHFNILNSSIAISTKDLVSTLQTVNKACFSKVNITIPVW